MHALLLLPLVLFATSASALELSSPNIHEGATIPQEQVYSRCGGQNISPALAWGGAPAGTKSFAITVIDLTVKPNGWSHWIVIGLPPTTTALGKGASLPPGAQAVMTDFGDAAYGGPCPPEDSGPHQYRFTVWSLPAATVSFPAHANAKDVLAALDKAALARASITAWYQR